MEDGLTKQKNRLLYFTLIRNNVFNFCKLEEGFLNLPWLDLPFQNISSLTFSQPNVFAFRSVNNRKIIENLLNKFDNTYNFYNVENKKELKNGLKLFCKIFAESLGIVNPTVFIHFDVDYIPHETPLAEVNGAGFVYYNIIPEYQIHKIESMPYEFYSRDVICNIPHEFTHIKQMAVYKKMCNGEAIPQFDEFCLRMDLMTDFVEEYFYRTEQENLFPKLSTYCTNPCEIIARANSFFFMQELIKILPDNKQELWQQNQELMLKKELQTYLKINIQETFKINFDYIINKFNELYSDTKMGQKMIADFNKLDIPLIYSQFDDIFNHIDKLAENVVIDKNKTVSPNLSNYCSLNNNHTTNVDNLQNFESSPTLFKPE